MLSQLYKPKNINELSFNNNLSDKLKNIGLQNYIIYGNHGSGKLTRVYCHLANVFNESVHQTRLYTYNLSKNIDITYKTSNYHIEISPGDYGTNDKTIISNFIGELASTPNVVTNNVKVFVIKDADKLSYKAQNAMRNMIENTYRTARYILTCTNINKIIEPLKSRFLLLRNPLPSKQDVNKILKELSNKIGIKTSTRAINIIIDNSFKLTDMINLVYAINVYQISYITDKYLRYDINITQPIDDLIKLVDKNFSPQKMDKIREQIYNIYTSNINMSIVIIYVMRYFINYVNDYIHKYKIIRNAAKYEYLMISGNKEPLYLETYILKIIKTLMSANINKKVIKKTVKSKNIKSGDSELEDIKVL